MDEIFSARSIRNRKHAGSNSHGYLNKVKSIQQKHGVMWNGMSAKKIFILLSGRICAYFY